MGEVKINGFQIFLSHDNYTFTHRVAVTICTINDNSLCMSKTVRYMVKHVKLIERL